jgi:serine/threonine-protein kinase
MEAKVSGRVQHPNVIEVLDVGQAEDGSLFLVMELLQGDSLEHAMRKQDPPMSVYEFLLVMNDVARAMSAAHRAGVVHRDLKPSNVLLHKDREGVAVPKVLDFGVSKFVLEQDRDHSLTIAGTVLGSPLYMSPEQAMGQLDIDHRTDVFAFGAVLFEGLCGFRCYDAPNFNALIVTIATQQPKSIDQYAPQMPETVRALVRDCLVTDKNKRIDSFDRVVERLAPMLTELEKNPLRLPKPARRPGDSPTDPEGTAAMPAIIRATSDRPPPMPMPDQPPTSGSAAPWAGSLPGYRPASRPPILLFVIGGALFASLFIVIVVGLAFAQRQRNRAEAVAAQPSATTPASVAVTPPPSASSSSDVPVISIDSLPVATSSKIRTSGGGGKLAVEATPQACTITVDGKAHGTTPIASMDLPAGTHQVRCETSSGVAKIVSVSVVEGQTTHQRFSTSP